MRSSRLNSTVMGSKRNKLKKALSPADSSPIPSNDDEQLMDDLMAQLDSRDENVQVETARVLQAVANEQEDKPKRDAKDRFLARQARKAAALAANFTKDDPEAEAKLEKEARDEEKAINAVCDELGLKLHEVNPDGHCLFSAIADQLALLSIIPPNHANYAAVRLAASNYIYSHPDDFLPFLPSDDGGIMSPKQFEQYCVAIRDTATWGGEPEILALSRAYNVPIHVIQGENPPVVIHKPTGAPQEQDTRSKRALRISYHRRMYGLGEHYNSLRPRAS
ncbi:hypothetical protein C8J56DRAFT_230152 [Mycena floridula]|nr:hypothetical protein C8J56DRAFT_230152 [Mycena floridula]